MAMVDLERLAEIVVGYSVRVRPGDLVTIVGEPESFPAALALAEATARAGGHPSFHVRSDRLQAAILRHGERGQWIHTCPFERERLARCDVFIMLRQPQVRRPFEGIDVSRVVAMQAARRELTTMSLARDARGETRYVLVEIPDRIAAEEAGMSLAEYASFVRRACFLHLPDPVAAWRRQHDRQERLCERLRRTRTLRFVVPNPSGEGTDLTVEVGGRTWINCSGQQNFPDGEVFSGPVSVDGVVRFTSPAWYRGETVEGVRLRFENGRVVDASATVNEEFLLAVLDTDEGARAAGEIAIGTNPEVTTLCGNPFFDEKVAGTFHIAVGAGFPETGNANESAVHWDLVCDLRPGADGPGGTVFADGEAILERGDLRV